MDDRFWGDCDGAFSCRVRFWGIREYCYAVCAALFGKRYRNEACHRRWDFWWYSVPMAVFSFLEENDLSGKKVVLFCSHGTGGLAFSVKDISAVLPDSEIETNVLGDRDDIPECQETINNWLEEIGY